MTGATTPSDIAWADIVGQDDAVARLRAAVRAPVHAYLLVGPRGSQKRAAARAFAADLLAGDATAPDADRHRRLALAEAHPDLVVVERVGAAISAEQVDEVVRLAGLKPFEGRRKILVLDELHRIDPKVGPKLLKSVEEPPASTCFVILADEVPPELVTVASRCVRIDFRPVPAPVIAARLEVEGVDADRAAQAADAAGGDLGRARLLATDERLGARRRAWRSAPTRLDGTGAAAATVAAELRATIDDAQAPLDERHRAEVVETTERIERYGERRSGLKTLDDRHKRERRRLREDELRAGLATLAGTYRDDLAAEPDPSSSLRSLELIHQAAEALVRNPNETLLLDALFARLAPLGAAT